MKFVLFLLLCSSATAAELIWDANPAVEYHTNGSTVSSNVLLGYRAHWGNASGYYDSVFDVGNVTNLALPESSGRIHYVVTAYDDQLLESEYSDEVFYDWPVIATPPSRPMNLRFAGTNALAQIRLQQSAGLVGWQDTGVAFMPVTNSMAFFRAAAPANGNTLPPKAMTTLKPTAGSKAGKH